MSRSNHLHSFRGGYLLCTVGGVYLLLFFFNPPTGIQALNKTAAILNRILPVIGLVIIFTAIINTLLHPVLIARHLGQGSGVKGLLWSLAAGVLSHGPMYIWYPLLSDLRRHGMCDGLIASFTYARALKLPHLVLLISYFGLIYTCVLCLFILTGALLQGILLHWLMGGCGKRQERMHIIQG